MLLSIPTLAPEIPVSLTFGGAEERHLHMALAMSRKGMICDDDLAALSAPKIPAETFRDLIKQGWQRETADLFNFEFLSAYASLVFLSDDAHSELMQTPDGCGIVVETGKPTGIAVGATLEALEALHPGLGAKTMAIFDTCLCWNSPSFTPAGALDMATFLYWQGEFDETYVLEEMIDEGGDASDVPRRADLFGGMPDWASCPHSSKTRKKAYLTKLSKQHKDTRYGPFLTQMARLERELKVSEKFGELLSRPEGEGCDPMAVLYWSEENDQQRIFDDFYQYTSEMYSVDGVGYISFNLTEQGISEALQRLRQTGNLLRELDKALVLLQELADGT